MAQIVEDLLLLSRADNGEIQLSRKEMNLSEILKEMIPQAQFLAQPQNLHLQALLPEEEVTILGDPLRIRELFLNSDRKCGQIYRGRWTDYDPALKRPFRLPPVNEREKEFAEIRVTDTGIGIAKEDQERIFDRFFRVDKARSREQGGSGLGLSICKWIVEAHQGKILVESDLGKGSSFIVRLPLDPYSDLNGEGHSGPTLRIPTE